MNGVKISIISNSIELPPLIDGSFFHSAELFKMLEQTPRLTPYMVLATDSQGNELAHMLTMLRKRGAWLLSSLFTQGRSYGEGVYVNIEQKEELFQMMLHRITNHLRLERCFYIEFSDISKKMFGYRSFRENKFFPVAWMQIHNPLHHLEPELLLDEKTLYNIRYAREAGVITREATSPQEVHAFYQHLKAYYRFRFQRFIPHENIFQQLYKSHAGSIYITLFNNKVIGGSAVAYSGNNAYLWFTASRRKTYPHLHPALATIWHTIKTSYEQGKEHLYFLNVGLPYEKNKYREFILKFGGKPVSSYRWFHFSINWINCLFARIYSE